MFKKTRYLYNGTLFLCDDVKQLPRGVLKRLLTSESLQLQLENEAYTLLVAWLRHSPHADYPDSDGDGDEDEGDEPSVAWFKELAPLLRYHHMTTDFLANVVCRCSLMQRSGLLPSVMRSAIVQRDASSWLLSKEKMDTGERDRGVAASSASWELKASFTLEEVAALKPGKAIGKWCGVVAGYPACITVKRCTDDGDTLGAFMGIHVPSGASESGDVLSTGLGLKWGMALPPDVEMRGKMFFSHSGRGSADVFDKPWAGAVREGSPHFPGGKMEIKAIVKQVMKEK